MIGKGRDAMLNSHKTHLQPFFGCGKEKSDTYWMALLRQILVVNLLLKKLESRWNGVIKAHKQGERRL